MRHGQTQVNTQLTVDQINVGNRIEKNNDNIMLLAFRHAISESLSVQNMVDAFSDEYEDETGINTGSSLNEIYDSAEDSYTPDAGAQPSGTQLLIHFDGVDEATSTTDESPNAHSIAFNGNAQLDTADKQFGSASLLLDGSGDYLSIPNDTSINFQITDSFTLECWAKLDVLSAGRQYFFSHNNSSGKGYNLVQQDNGKVLLDLFQQSSGGVEINVITANVVLSAGTWHHIAVTYNGNSDASGIKIYIDGNQETTNTGNNGNVTDIQVNEPLVIGSNRGVNSFLDGHIDEVLITNTVKYTGSFTAPTAPYETPQDMTLISQAYTAQAQPSTSRIVLFEEDIDSITLNTDLKAFVSRDGGSTFAEVTLEDIGNYDSGKRILAANADLTASGIGAGTSMVYKIQTFNSKSVKIHGTGLAWD